MNRITFDRTSVRTFDADGRLHVAATNISKANVCDYFGNEIPGWQELGLRADKIYRMYRHPEALAKACDSFARQPVLNGHHDADADNPHKNEVVGAIGSNVKFVAPYLVADICVWDAAAIAGIENGSIRELSCAYRYEPDMTPGEVDGVQYDGVMRNIIGSHLALVDEGRAGHDVRVADSNTIGELEVENEEILDQDLPPEDVPMDEDIPPEITDEDPVDMPLDSDIIPEEEVVDEDPIHGATDIPEPIPDEDVDEKVQQATDRLREEFKQANIARARCRHIVGDALNCTTAEDIYRLALDQMGVKHDAIFGYAGLSQLFDAASSAQRTADAKSVKRAQDGVNAVTKLFPGLARFQKM